MKWNIDLDISAFLVIFVLLVFYVRRRALPIHRNRMFLYLMVVVELAVLSDIVASVLLNSHRVKTGIHYVTNIFYFVLILSVHIFFAFYCFSMVPMETGKRRRIGLILQVPFLASCAFMISAPWNHLAFTISKREFIYGYGGYVRCAEAVFYILVGAVYVTIHRDRLRRLFRYPVYTFGGIVAAANIVQTFFASHLMVISLAEAIGVLILYLVYQNPDFYRSSDTMLLMTESRRELKENDKHYGISRRMALMAFENYDELLSTYGDPFMRKVVRKVGGWMRTTFPKSYCFYLHRGRFLLVSDPGNRQLVRPFDKMKKHFQTPVKINQVEVFLEPCFAHVMEEFSSYTYEEMDVAMALALEEALRRRDGAVVELNEDFCKKAVRSIKVDQALDRAIKGKGLEVFYQPIYSTQDKRITSAEALVRIRDQELGLLFPDEFIWKAEENSSILMLGQQVFETVCGFIQKNDIRRLGLSYIEVNLSPVQCMRQQLADEFKCTVEKYGIEPSMINLEITESGNTVSEIIQKNMESLSEYGMTFSLDDYGTGFSNLINVLSMPLHIVKIDKSIVWAYFDKSSPMLVHVLEIFKESKLKIVCEGVETLEMVDKLTEMGCDYLQGYYFSKPVPADLFLSYLEEKAS